MWPTKLLPKPPFGVTAQAVAAHRHRDRAGVRGGGPSCGSAAAMPATSFTRSAEPRLRVDVEGHVGRTIDGPWTAQVLVRDRRNEATHPVAVGTRRAEGQ